MEQYRYKKLIEELSKKGSVYGIETMQRLLTLLNHPEKKLKIIHTAGTNGKGSTLSFLAEILTRSGYKVGRYISPTIQCYEERFQIDGLFISAEKLERLFENVGNACVKMQENGWNTPTIFEAETAIALLYFEEEQVDYALIEVGMGGLTDATNAIERPELCMITSISEDHKQFLGDTIEEIAFQKAGIIKNQVPVVLANNPEEVRKVVEKQCEEMQADLQEVLEGDYKILEEFPTGNTFLWHGENFRIHLPGVHQVDNAVTALTAAERLRGLGADKIRVETMVQGLEMTRWPGRLELLKEDPPFYLDGAHNPDGARKLARFLEKHFTNKKIVYIMGVLGDKEYPKMLSDLMPLCYRAYVFTPNNARGLKAEGLAKAMEPYDVPVTVCETVSSAVKMALSENKEADCFVLCGSLSFIEELRRTYSEETDC